MGGAGTQPPVPLEDRFMGDLGFRKQKGCQGLVAAPQSTPKMGLSVLAMAGRESPGEQGWASQLRPSFQGVGDAGGGVDNRPRTRGEGRHPLAKT